MITLNRNKIYSIGAKQKTVKIARIDRKSGDILNSFKVYRVVRGKEKCTCYCENEVLKLGFDSIISAKKFKENYKKALNNE